jgi:hypothetical protein
VTTTAFSKTGIGRWVLPGALALTACAGAPGEAPESEETPDASADAIVDADASADASRPADGTAPRETGADATLTDVVPLPEPEDVTAADAARADASAEDATVHDAGEPDATAADAHEADAASSDASVRDASGDAETDASRDAETDASRDAETDASADAGLGVSCAADAGGALSSTGNPLLLACTGLYANWATRTLAPGVVAYDPGLHLWADGAAKARYVYLPPGTKIDTTNMDEWTFPVGTKLWKEFTLDGLKVETRLIHKTASGWIWTTYQWSKDQTTAVELTTGATGVNGTPYEIPDHGHCLTCHAGRLDFVLGFEAIGLSTPTATGLRMSELVDGGWLTSPPASPLVIPGDATAIAALGWLHANCGNACHSQSEYALANDTGFWMRLSASGLATVQGTTTYQTGVNVEATFKEPDGGRIQRIAPGEPDASCVIFRDGYRDVGSEGIQMPPIDTHVVDTADLKAVSTWIASLPRDGG